MDEPIDKTVLVNAAAFITSRSRNWETIRCDLLEADADRLLIQTRFPYRVFTMWVNREWIEEEG